MISIYGINLLLDGETNEDRVLIQDVPATTGINLISPHCNLGMESSGSFEFSIQSDNEYYDAFQQMKTIIYIKYDADVIFFGRVLTVGNELFGARKIVCEGKMSMFLDTWFPPSEEKDRKSITVYQYLRDAISNHNDMTRDSDGPYGVGDYHKYFTLGNVPGNYDPTVSEDQKIENAEYKFGQSSWTQTKNVLEDLKSHYGGCFRVRYLEGYRNYQDLIGQYGQGNIDLNNRIVVHNPDGSFSTERSISIEVDNKIYLIPTVIDGQIVSNDDAIDYFFRTNQYLGIFDTNAEADMYAEKLHKRQEWYYGGQPTYFFMNSYLDWYDQYFDVNISAQTIEIGKNLMNMDESTEVDNIFTWIIPVGKSGNGLVYLNGSRRLFVSDLCGIYTDAELNTGYHNADDYRYAMKWYGSIGKVVQFDDKQNPEDLKTAAAKWVKDNYHGTISSITVDAVDMHMIGGAESQIHVGDRVMLKFPYGKAPNPPIVTRQMTCLEIKYDFYNPEKTQYVFGIPSMALTKNYHSSGSKSKKNASDGSGYTPPVYVPPQENEFDLWFNSLLSWLEQHKVWKKSNGGQEGGPNPGDGTRPVFLAIEGSPELDDEGNSKDRLWKPVVSHVINQADGIYQWRKTNGKPNGTFTAIKHSDLTWKTINDYHLVEYVRDEYGIDLRQKGNSISSNMPIVVDNGDGTIDILGGIIGGGSDTSGSPSDLIGKIMSFVGVNGSGTSGEVMKIFNKDGVNIAQLLMNDGNMKFVELGDDDKPVPDPDHPGEYKFVDIDLRKMYTTTGQLAKDLEDMGISVELLDKQVTLIGQTVGDSTSGLVKDLADMGNTVSVISNDVTVIGQVVGDSTSGLVKDLADMDKTVTVLSGDVTIIGQTVGDSTKGLVKDLADMGNTVSVLSNDVTIIGQKVGDETSGLVKELADMDKTVTVLSGDVTLIGQKIGDETSGLVKDLADMGSTVSVLSNDVTIIGQTVGDSTSGLVKDLADMGSTVSVLSNDVTIIGQTVGDSTSGLVKDLADMGADVTQISTQVTNIGDVVGDSTKGLVKGLADAGATITMLNNAINIINADQLTEEQQRQIEEYAAKGLTVTAIGSDLVTIRGDLSAARAKISSIESDYIKTSQLYASIAALEKVQVKALTSEQGGVSVKSVSTDTLEVGGVSCYVPAGVRSVKVVEKEGSPGTYELLYRTYAGFDTDPTKWESGGTFERAASGGIDNLLGNWSGNASDANGQLFTVSTSPDTGKTLTVGFGNASVNCRLGVGRNTDEAVEPSESDPTLLMVPVRIFSELTETPYTKTTRYKGTVPADASSVYIAGESAGRSTVKISTKWNRNILSYSKSTKGEDSGTIAFGSRFYTYPDSTTFVNKYAIEVVTAIDGTPTGVSNTQKYYHLGISNNSSSTALVYMYDDSNNVIAFTPYISLASYWDNAYNSAHVKGSWDGNAFTYEKTNEAGTSDSGTVLIGSGIGKVQTPGNPDDKIYAYANHWTSSATTPVVINSSKKELTIVDVENDNNKVKLQASGNDTGLIYTHNKFTAGYTSAHVSGSWTNNSFTYQKVNTSGAADSGSVHVGVSVGRDPNGDPSAANPDYYAYTTTWNASATTPVAINTAQTKKKLTITDKDDNTVKLQVNGSDTGLTYAHNKYTDGTAYGKTIASITESWDRSNPSSSANPIDTLNIKREGTTVKSHLMSADVGLSYDTSTHKYTATARAKVDGTERGAASSTISGTEAFDAGKLNASITESWDRSNPSSSANPIDTLNIKREGTTVKSHLMSAAVGLSYDTSTHKYTATAKAKVDGTERGAASSTISGTEAFDAGNTNGMKSVTPTDIAWISSGSYFETHNPNDTGKTVGEAVQLVWRTASSKYYVTLQSRKNGTQNSWNNRINNEYKLGLSGTKVQVQNSSGSKLSNTPEYTIPLTTKDITSSGTYTPDTGYVGFSSVKVTVTHSPSVIDNTVYAVSTEPKSSDGYTPVSGPVIDTDGHWCQFSVRCGSTTNKYKFSIDASEYGTASYNSGYGAAHVTGSWSNNAFTYSKTTSGSSNSGTVYVGCYVGKDPSGDPQDSTIYALTQRWTSSATTPVTISNTKRALSITNVSNVNNSVKLQSGGSDTGLTFYHGKYDAGWAAAVSKLSFSGVQTGAEHKNRIWISYPQSAVDGSERADFWLVDDPSSHRVNLWLGNAGGGTTAIWAYTGYSVPKPSASNISLGNWQVSELKPQQIDSYTDLTTLSSYIRNNRNTYIWFSATISGGSGVRWFRVTTL